MCNNESWIEGTVLFGLICIVRLFEGPCEINVSYQMLVLWRGGRVLQEVICVSAYPYLKNFSRDCFERG